MKVEQLGVLFPLVDVMVVWKRNAASHVAQQIDVAVLMIGAP